MSDEQKFVKNPKTGVVFAKTNTLVKMRPDLIPCTKEGVPVSYSVADMPCLYNPFTDSVIPFTEENARIQGLIPCRDEDHAAEIKQALMGMSGDDSGAGETGEVSGLKEPVDVTKTEPPLVAPAITSDDAFIEKLRLTNLDAMDKTKLKDFAMDNFQEKLNGRLGEDVLREQVQVMINAKVSEAA